MDWIVVGSSQTGREWTERLLQKWPDAVTIASNRSVEWFAESGWPLDFAFVFDSVACEKYRNVAYKMQSEGTQLVTLNRSRDVLARRGVERFDEFLPAGQYRGNAGWYEKGKWNDMALSGLWCLQYALNNGAETVHLAGHEGYRGKPSDYDHGQPHPRANDLTFGVIEPAMNAICRACEDVQFVFYGDLAYEVRSFNATTINRFPAGVGC